MEAKWNTVVQRFLLNNLGQMDQELLEAWLEDALEIAPLLEEPLRALSSHRDQILREMHQITPQEIFDRFQKEHPELTFSDKTRAIVKIGKEIEAMKRILVSV
jgi:hypothetical protein